MVTKVKHKKSHKKIWIVVIFFLVLTISGIFTLDHFLLGSRLLNQVESVLHIKEEDTYTNSNKNSFNGVEVDFWLQPEDGNIKDYSIVPIVYDTTIIYVPIPNVSDIRNSYYDSIYDNNGTFYITLSKSSKSFSENSISLHRIGFNKPVILEVRFSGTNAILYIQCYTPEILFFYQNYDWFDESVGVTEYDLSLTTDALALKVSYDDSLYEGDKDIYLEDEMLSIVANNRAEFDGFSDFYPTESGYFNYFRGIGYLDSRMRVEYAKMVCMGLTPIEVGKYRDVYYIKFDGGVTVLGSSITTNSCFIYHVTSIT